MDITVSKNITIHRSGKPNQNETNLSIEKLKTQITFVKDKKTGNHDAVKLALISVEI